MTDMTTIVNYYLAPQSPWTYLGHQRLMKMVEQAGAQVRVIPMDLGKVFPVSGGLPLGQRAPQRQAYRFVDLERFSKHLQLPVHLKPKFFPVAGDDAARLIASNRPIVWSADYQPSKALQNVLDERAVNGIFYGEVAEFKFPTRIVVTRSPATSLVASSWQSPVLIASADESQSEVERARELLGRFPNIASITVADRELSLTPFRNLS